MAIVDDHGVDVVAASSSRPAGLRLTVVLAVVVLGAPGALIAWAWSVADRLPDPVARHWGLGGTADGFSSLGATLAIAVMISLAVAVPCALAAVAGRVPVSLRRCLAGVAAGVPVFLTVLVADSLRLQVGLTDPSDAPTPDLGIGVGVLAGLVLGAAVAMLVRRGPAGSTDATKPPPASAPRLPATAEASWSGRLHPARPLLVLTVVVTVLMAVLSVTLGWGMAVLGVAVVAVLIAALDLRVSIAPEVGLCVSTLGGVRLLTVSPAEIAEAGRTEVRVWDFGGWGVRVDLHGRTGVITRSGEALHVRRGDGSEVVVTLDDAALAAARLNTIAERHHAR